MSDLERTGRRLQTATIVWNLIEVFITITLGLLAGSLALVAFGLDSLIEVFASVVVLWHMNDTKSSHRDRRARTLVAAAFALLALYLTVAGIRALLTGAEPDSSPLGIAYLALTAMVMFSLAAWKSRIGKRLDSDPFLAEARMTYLDGWLAAAILTALALNTTAGWWWADPAAALIVAIAAAREAHELSTDPERPHPRSGSARVDATAPRLRGPNPSRPHTRRRAPSIACSSALRVDAEVVNAASRWVAMTYIVQRKSRFYVVAYDGIDTLTGRERRRWHPAGHSRADAEAIAANLDDTHAALATPSGADPLTVARYLTEQWLPIRRHDLDPSTAHRYGWMIDHYITTAIGHLRLRSLRTEHLDRLYTDLLATGGQRSQGLAPKTVYDVHVICRSALNHAIDAHLIATNPAHGARAPKPQRRQRHSPDCWTAHQLSAFLEATRHLRLHPALVLAATTGMRRGELAGLRWSDWNQTTHTVSIARARKSIGGRTVETPVKTRSSRRSIDLDPTTETTLATWRRRQDRDGHPVALADPIFSNHHGHPVHPESISQLFARHLARLEMPRIRFHDLRHTHATLLIGAGVPTKVVSERLGHANPGFTMATYQHVLPGMGADAANRFAALIATDRDHKEDEPSEEAAPNGR